MSRKYMFMVSSLKIDSKTVSANYEKYHLKIENANKKSHKVFQINLW